MNLSLSLAGAHFKLRNEGSYLGILWYLLNPLALFAVLLFVKHAAFSASVPIQHYPLYLFVGLVMQNYLNRAVAGSVDIIRKNAGFIKSIQIPLEALVISSVMHMLYAHAFEMILVAGLVLYFGVSLSMLLFYAVSVILFTLFILGLSFVFATIGAYANDVQNVWNVVSQILFFITPIFYSVHPGTFLHAINQFNPLYYFITFARWPAIAQSGMTAGSLFAALAGFSFLSLGIGLFVFEKSKRKFAELV